MVAAAGGLGAAGGGLGAALGSCARAGLAASKTPDAITADLRLEIKKGRMDSTLDTPVKGARRYTARSRLLRQCDRRNSVVHRSTAGAISPRVECSAGCAMYSVRV